MDYGDVDALFIGKIETWDEIKNDLPAEMPIIRFPKYDGCSNVTKGHKWHEFINSHNPIQNPNNPNYQIYGLLFLHLEQQVTQKELC